VELAVWSSLPLVTMLPNGSEAESGGPKREAASSMVGFGEWFVDRRTSAAAINAETTANAALPAPRRSPVPFFSFHRICLLRFVRHLFSLARVRAQLRTRKHMLDCDARL
jgi:hypothetical protein